VISLLQVAKDYGPRDRHTDNALEFLFTGHSLGGALAVLAVRHFALLGKEGSDHWKWVVEAIQIVTVAAPRCLSMELVNQMHSLVPRNIRIVSAIDPVPKMSLLFHHSGHLLWFALILPGVCGNLSVCDPSAPYVILKVSKVVTLHVLLPLIIPILTISLRYLLPGHQSSLMLQVVCVSFIAVSVLMFVTLMKRFLDASLLTHLLAVYWNQVNNRDASTFPHQDHPSKHTRTPFTRIKS